ncbi:fungal-specific transcription factor domain-containing protein [Boeremia exigua]|uniref:fungal-specific transcription factor domain-containing protein n=1 Tax=Boeremia exigua TaxID=749465 RepID=UPI001E8EE23A|nr:fungal-specific transcription factor domain-containing protein [Boeremia exigua]KAH6622350.1 fungal-specific transcription factor domain-containing protein [Boeremia exigua]
MDADRRLSKALEAANDALQHLSMSPDFSCLDCTHIDRLIGRVVDLPTEGNQRNSRRNLLVIRQWMITEGPGVVLLEVLGQLYWRLGELNSKQFEKFKMTLQQQQPYLSLIQDTAAVTLVLQRLQHIQRLKAEACQEFLYELSDLTGMKILSPIAGTDSSRSRSSSPFTPVSAHSSESDSPKEPGYTSLIKYVPSVTAWTGDIEHLLMDFYVHGICPGRTVATQSDPDGYVSMLQVAKTCSSTRYALLSLSASYISEHIPSRRDYFQHAELYYSTQALQALTTQITNGDNYDGAIATSMLLMHQSAVNNSPDSPLCWSCHANIFDIVPDGLVNHQSAPALFIRGQLTLARTAQTAQVLQSAQLHSLETTSWFESIPSNEAQKICSILGFSPQLMFIISSITSLAFDMHNTDRLGYAQALESQLQSMKQWTTEPQGPEHEVLLVTAEAFRLAGLIYLRCRLYGMTRFHPSILDLTDALYTLILSLPVQGALYTAIYPVWPLFVAAVTLNSDKRDRVYQRVVPIREGDRNTLPSVLKRVSGMRVWLAQQDSTCHRRDCWWEEMLSPSSSTTALRTNLLCLG